MFELRFETIAYLLMMVIVGWLWYLSHDPHPDIKGIEGNTIFGTLFEQIKYREHKIVFKLFQRLTEYGPISKMRGVFGRYVYVVSDAPSAKKILTDAAFERKTVFQDAVIDIMPNALFALPMGDTWKHHRKLLQPGFGPVHLNHALKAVSDSMDQLNTFIRSQAKKSAIVDVYDAANAVTLDVIGQVAFGYDIKAVLSFINGKENEGKQVMDDATTVTSKRIGVPQSFWGYTSHKKDCVEVKRINNYFENAVFPHIQARRKEIQKGEVKKDFQMDFLQRLLTADETISEKEILDEIKGFFIAGHETTGNSIASAMMEIADTPQIQNKIYKEIQSILKPGQELTSEILGQFKYVEQVVKETLRLYSVVQVLTRMSVQPVELMGHKFASNSVFIIPVGAVQKSSLYWDEPEKFNPDRWEKQPVPGSYMPFGDGPMNCIGQKMAMIELKVFIIKMVQAFTMKLVPDQKLRFLHSITYGLKDGVKIELTPRPGQ